MTALDETRERYGIPEEVAVKIFDYSSIPACDLLRKIEELRAKVKESAMRRWRNRWTSTSFSPWSLNSDGGSPPVATFSMV